MRRFHPNGPSAELVKWTRVTQFHPGAGEPVPAQTETVTAEYDENAYALSEGKRLFDYYNCSGCHAHGGGAIGPPLMDNAWIYGSQPQQIFATIVEGRPNGMPSWGGRIPEYQVWELTAYVRSMSGLTPQDAAPGRNDEMQGPPPSNSQENPKPVNSSAPPGVEAPQ